MVWLPWMPLAVPGICLVGNLHTRPHTEDRLRGQLGNSLWRAGMGTGGANARRGWGAGGANARCSHRKLLLSQLLQRVIEFKVSGTPAGGLRSDFEGADSSRGELRLFVGERHPVHQPATRRLLGFLRGHWQAQPGFL